LNADGTALGSQGYLPWGKVNFTEGTIPTEYTFTGQYSDSCIKLLWYNSRWYDPYLNRWAQPDSIISDPYNSLDYDRYQYVRSNPIKYVDPSGRSVDCALGETCNDNPPPPNARDLVVSHAE
jgi:RHS repeat-associated protein